MKLIYVDRQILRKQGRTISQMSGSTRKKATALMSSLTMSNDRKY
jgi:hypothetical protein